MSKQTIRFIINPISGGISKRAIARDIDEVINKQRYDVEVWSTRYAGHGAVMAAMAAENGINKVVAVGGDGTVNEVARSLLHTDTELGIVPCGSGNGLARHLQIPLEPKKALSLINDGHSVSIDYGLLNNHPFFCTCGLGFDAEISYKFSFSKKRGMISYLENIVSELSRYKPQAYTIIDESGQRTYKAFIVTLANASQYGNNAYIAPYASLADGLMDVTVIEPFPAVDAPALALDLFTGRFRNGMRHIRMFRSNSIRILREKAGVVHCDGDPMKAGSEIRARIVPAGLRVITSSDAEAQIQPLYKTVGEGVASIVQQPAATFRQASGVIMDLFKIKRR